VTHPHPDEEDVAAPLQGVVTSVAVVAGQHVRAGQTLLYVESMKLEHPVTAPRDGVVAALLVAPGAAVARDEPVARLRPVAATGEPDPEPDDAPRPDERADLAELHDRRAWLADAARPDAVARRHAAGRRTARENLADLVDPGSWVEYGGLAVAAQRAIRDEAELAERTPADGFVGGLATVNAGLFGADAARCAVASYDYLVMAGTQGMVGHRKKDRLFDVVRRLRVPAVLFAEGGGGRPNDTDVPVASALDTMAFQLWAGLSGLVPRVGVASGYCFAGNAGLLGCSDVVIATAGSSIGMGGPAMIEGAGLGAVRPQDVGPVEVHARAGSVDLVVADDAAAVAAVRRVLSYFQGRVPAPDDGHDQTALRDVVPEDRKRAYDVRTVIGTLADPGSVLELRREFAPGVVTALVRLGGRPVGVVASNCAHDAGAITSDVADKAARMLHLCETFRLPVLSLIDTPGIMVGPEAEATGLVRHAARLFTAGARLTVPLVAVVLRKAYGLGAQAMAGGSLLAPLLTMSWPTGEFGPMGIEGAVTLGLRRHLESIEDPAERESAFRAAVDHQYAKGRALSVAAYAEIDDVVDPAETRARVLAVLSAAKPDDAPPRPWLDTW
jgi:acetyl-CoA carboxylase carboxyltransferase component